MKILMIAPRLPYPPDKGEKIRTFNELRYLARRHELWCACLTDDAADVQHVEALRQLCRDVAVFPLRRAPAMLRALLGLAAGGTFTEGYFRSGRLAATIARWSAQVGFDAVLAFSSSVARYGLDLPARRRVLDLCDVDSAKWASYAGRSTAPMRWVFATEARRLVRREWALALAYDATTVISPREVERFELAGETAGTCDQGATRPELTVVRNGIDLEAFAPDAEPATEPIVGFVGTMDYRPNVEAVCWFVESVWPAVHRDCPDARFLIVGRSPHPRVQALTRRPGVEATGAVPEIAEYLRRMQVCVAPLQMVHGVQNKVLEGMACAKPVVVTPEVAETVEAEVGRELLVAKEPEQWAEEISALLADADRRGEVGLAARKRVEASYRWDDQLEGLEGLLVAE